MKMKKIKIQAILTIDSMGNYNICGWNSCNNTKNNQLDIMKDLSEEGLDYSSNPKRQFLIEQEIEMPDFELEKINIDVKEL